MNQAILSIFLIFGFIFPSVGQQIDIAEELIELTQKRTVDFAASIFTIANKTIDDGRRNEAINSAVNMFVSPKNIVQVSSLNRSSIDSFPD